MSIKTHIRNRLEEFAKTRAVRTTVMLLRKFTLPGFEKMPVWDVVEFFIRGIRKSSLLSRANSLSFTVTLAIFPTILFLFTLIPYVPITGLQESIMATLADVLPEQLFSFLEGTITEIVSKHNGGLLSLGFFMAFYFSNSGMIGIMKAFNRSAHAVETRSWFRMQLASIGLQIIIVSLLIIAAALLILTPLFINYVTSHTTITGGVGILLIQFVKWIVFMLLIFLTLSFIYYFAPAGKRVFRFISPGSTMATLLALIFILIFNMYIDHFSQYNRLYGSIGTVIILMLYININAIALLIGFELNASIYDAQLKSSGNFDEDE